MRAGGCSIHQSLTLDAAAIVKQAISLARRRGHAQVTPLHVANTMLSSSTGLLRSACLQSHSHPLQCKALELCFNVALNRLPAASPSSPLLPPQHPPSLSNALIAAFKRAQAHQRRGSIENQQQPLLSVKIELEQLIVSILDDPSVSRVMREAGFSSTQVKSNVEQAISLEPNANPNPNPNPSQNPKRATHEKADEDITSLVESLTGSKKRSIVVVGECLANTDGVVKGLMERVDKGQVPEILTNLQFITLPLLSFSGMSRGEVEQKLSELKCLLMKNCCVGKGVVLYLEDIKWVAEFRANSYDERAVGFYCPVEHMIMEIGKLVFSGIIGNEDGGRGARFWLMAISTYQTYMKCKIGSPSLEIVWGLQPLTIPVGSLELSLNCDNCDAQSLHKGSISGAWPILQEDRAGNQLTCCTNFPIKFEKDAQASTTSTLPPWLQHYKEKNKKDAKDEDCLNSINRLQNHTSEITLHFSSTSPSNSSTSSYNQHNTVISLNQSHHLWKKNQVWLSEGISRAFPFTIFKSSYPNPNLTSTANTMDMEHCNKFKEVNAENLKIMCNALERKVPWQKAIIPEIASTILQCRAGMMRKNKEDTWLFFQGGDIEGKEKVARELASLVFGHQTSFFVLGLSSSSSTKSDSTDDVRNKRSRSEGSHGFLEKLAQALRENPHRVFFVEDIEQVDFHSQVGIKNAIERGTFQSLQGEEVPVEDAIVILSCELFDSRSRGCSPPVRQKLEMEEDQTEEEVSHENENNSHICLDLNLCAPDSDELWCSWESERFLGVVDRAFFFKMPEDL